MLPPSEARKRPAAYPTLKPIWEFGSEPPLDNVQYLAEALEKTQVSLRAERKVFLGLHEKILLQARPRELIVFSGVGSPSPTLPVVELLLQARLLE